jgi:hypothetical protein
VQATISVIVLSSESLHFFVHKRIVRDRDAGVLIYASIFPRRNCPYDKRAYNALRTYNCEPREHLPFRDKQDQTFDALGNLAEQNIPSYNSTLQYLHDEQGAELGFAQAQSAGWTWIPLPGGATAVYVGGNLQNYWHSDWLGSVRFGSTPGRGMFSDRAFAPFGEPYASAGNTAQSVAGLLQNLFPDLFETPNREYHPTQGRWIIPGEAGGTPALYTTLPAAHRL